MPTAVFLDRLDGLGHRPAVGGQAILGGEVDFLELDVQPRRHERFQECLESHLGHRKRR